VAKNIDGKLFIQRPFTGGDFFIEPADMAQGAPKEKKKKATYLPWHLPAFF
jgi:hypothetical protein